MFPGYPTWQCSGNDRIQGKHVHMVIQLPDWTQPGQMFIETLKGND